jgi:hypothetical protein
MYVIVLEDILRDLDTMAQWSKISRGRSSRDIVLASISQEPEYCRLDDNGKAATRERVTDLIAGSYVEAVRIYLMVRGLRYVLVQ